MSQYHHHPDGLIYVRTAQAIYVDTVANFALDFGRIWPLPEGLAELLYEDGPQSRHVVFDPAGNQRAGALPFPFGDAAIAAIDSLLASQAKRNPPPPTLAALPKGPSVSMGTKRV